MKRILAVLASLVVAATVAGAFPAPDASPLAPLKFLEGKWIGEGSSEAGAGGGYATFEEDLQAKVIVRRNHAEYPATKDRPVYKHDDLMVIYLAPGSKSLRAFYTDNEGHVIHYAVSASADGTAVIFLSDKDAAGPQYRLTYTRLAENKMSILLEAAQPSDAAHFQKIVEGKMMRTAA